MARRFCRWLVVALVVTASSGVPAADQCARFKFEQVQSLSLRDFGRMAKQKVITGEFGAIAFAPFDEEDYPRQGGLRAIGLIFARVGDLGETPVGGYIWISQRADYVGYSVKNTAGSILITFHIRDRQHCQTSRLSFELREMGKVYVNGAYVGTVK